MLSRLAIDLGTLSDMQLVIPLLHFPADGHQLYKPRVRPCTMEKRTLCGIAGAIGGAVIGGTISYYAFIGLGRFGDMPMDYKNNAKAILAGALPAAILAYQASRGCSPAR
jgi:hypothetical protein